MQNAAFALGEAAIDRCGVGLCKLRLEVLVDQQQRAHTAPRRSPWQLATISSIAVSLDLRLIEILRFKSGQILPVFPASPRVASTIGAHPRLNGGTDRGDYKETTMTTA